MIVSAPVPPITIALPAPIVDRVVAADAGAVVWTRPSVIGRPPKRFVSVAAAKIWPLSPRITFVPEPPVIVSLPAPPTTIALPGADVIWSLPPSA